MELKTIHLNARGMSGRVVKFAVLDPEDVDREELNAAEEAGADASPRKLRQLQLRTLTRAMIVAYTEPGFPARMLPVPEATQKKAEQAGVTINPVALGEPDPDKLATATWIAADPTLLKTRWSSVFTTKDTEALRQQYSIHHEMSQVEAAMLSGKSQPVPTGG